MLAQQAVLLVGGLSNKLFPLTSPSTPKALLNVGNQPLISFPVKLLEEGGIKDIFLICPGESIASKIHGWAKSYAGNAHLEVRCVPEDKDSADALRSVVPELKGKAFILISGDLVGDVSVKAISISHFINSALVTAVLVPRRISPASTTKPGKAPKNVDYVGLDPKHRQLLFFKSSPESRQDVLRLPPSAVQTLGQLEIRTDFTDVHLYIFDRQTVTELLDQRPQMTSIKQDLVPYMVNHQRRLQQLLSPLEPAGSLSPVPSTKDSNTISDSLPPAPNLLAHPVMGVDAVLSGSIPSIPCHAYMAAKDCYCARANNLHAYADVNRLVDHTELGILNGTLSCWAREVVASEHADRLLDAKLNAKHGNYVHEGVQLGSKTTVASACMVGRGSSLGDKCSVKRSVLGANCRLGGNVKIINSVLMDGIVVDDGCHVQNSIVCNGAHLQERCSLKDTAVGPDYVVTEGSEHREATLAKSRPTSF